MCGSSARLKKIYVKASLQPLQACINNYLEAIMIVATKMPKAIIKDSTSKVVIVSPPILAD